METPEQRFVALVPFPRRIPPARILAALQGYSNETGKYVVGEISEVGFDGDIAMAHLRLNYRRRVEQDLTARAPARAGLPAVRRVLDFMFQTTFIVVLDSAGKLVITPHLPSEWSASDRELAANELGVHYFHFVKYLVQRLQRDGHLPNDFEFKRHLTKLSDEPEYDLIRRFEEVTASARQATVIGGIKAFAESERALRGGWRRLCYLVNPMQVNSLRNSHSLLGYRAVNTTRSTVSWLRWVAWHGLQADRPRVDAQLAGRTEAALADFLHIEKEHESFVSQQNNISAELSQIVGIAGVALTIAIGGIQLRWDAWIIAPIGLFAAWDVVLLYSVWRGLGALSRQAEIVRELYRSDPPTDEAVARTPQRAGIDKRTDDPSGTALGTPPAA